MSFTAVFSYFYIKYDRIIEQRFRTPVFSNSAKIYALPRTVRDGEKIEARGDRSEPAPRRILDKEGAVAARQLPRGQRRHRDHARARSPTTARSRRGSAIQDGQVRHITSKGNELSAYELEPQLVTALFDAGTALEARSW